MPTVYKFCVWDSTATLTSLRCGLPPETDWQVGRPLNIYICDTQDHPFEGMRVCHHRSHRHCDEELGACVLRCESEWVCVVFFSIYGMCSCSLHSLCPICLQDVRVSVCDSIGDDDDSSVRCSKVNRRWPYVVDKATGWSNGTGRSVKCATHSTRSRMYVHVFRARIRNPLAAACVGDVHVPGK